MLFVAVLSLSTISVIIAIATYLCWLAWERFRFCQIIAKIPGPTAYPLVGNTLQFHRDSEKFYKQQKGRAEEYEKEGIYVLWLAHIPLISVYKPEYVEKILTSSRNTTKSTFYKLAQPWLGTGLLTSHGEKWKSRRKLLTPAFHFKILNNFVPIYVKQSAGLIEILKGKVGESAFDIAPYVTLCVLDIICETSMGVDINAQFESDSEYVQAVLRISILIMQRAKSPWLWPDLVHNLTSHGKEHNKLLGKLHGFTNKVINDRIKEREEHKETKAPTLSSTNRRILAFLDLLLEEYDNGNISKEGVREEVDTFMFEGHDTTATSLVWTLYLVAKNKDVQVKLQSEVDTFYDSVDGQVITGDHLKQLSYMECVIKESLRLYPSVPSYGRTISEDMTFGPYEVPKGCVVSVPPIFLHRNPLVWPNPSTFDPDRFTLDNCKARSLFAHVPFSAGPRNCIGQRFALMEEKVVLSTIIRHFDIDTSQNEEDLGACGNLIFKPTKGVWLTLKNRCQ